MRQRYYLYVESADGTWRIHEDHPDVLRQYIPQEGEQVRLLRRFERGN